MLFRTQIIFCSSELRLHFRIAEVGSLLSLNRAWRAQVTNFDNCCTMGPSGSDMNNIYNRYSINTCKLVGQTSFCPAH